MAEAHSLARIDQPKAVKVQQVFRQNDTAGLALDHVEGQDLPETTRPSALALTPDGVTATLLRLPDAVAAVREAGERGRAAQPRQSAAPVGQGHFRRRSRGAGRSNGRSRRKSARRPGAR